MSDSAPSFNDEKKQPLEIERHSDDSRTLKREISHREVKLTENVNARLANPLSGIPHDKLWADAVVFAHEYGLSEFETDIAKGALVAQDPKNFESLPQLTEEDKADLRHEITHKWSQTKTLYWMVVMCSMGAIVQGMDESVINGAQLFYPSQFGLDPDHNDKDQWIMGLVNSAPYLCCAVLGCWLTAPLNNLFGRRGTIFITATLSWLACFWQGVTNSWQHLFVARLVLGLGIGPKSATVPVFAAECAPATIRGALVMMWQIWTAFGIMLGNAADLILYHVPDSNPNITGLRWRLMLGSAGLPAIIVMAQVFFIPESPRWLMGKGKYPQALNSLQRFRGSNLQAGRDLYYIHVALKAEASLVRGSAMTRFFELFTVPRNRRATLASLIVMFGQQFCGINVIAYYSSDIFAKAGFSEISSLLASWGFGMVNWVFALPGFLTIDHFGRRNLLLTTFPLMAACLLLTGFSFWIEPEVRDSKPRIAVVAVGIYLFAAAYSPGEGPVPFTYSAEVYPLTHRELGMSLSTAVLWLFNFILAVTWPRLLGAFKEQGAFGWYAAWCMILFFLILLFVPETKSLTLEELDQVFSVPTHKHASYGWRQIPYFINRYILRRNVKPEQLYNVEDDIEVHNHERPYTAKGEAQA